MFAYRRRLMRLVVIGISAMLVLALAGPGVAIACEGASVELENETTHEKGVPFDPHVNRDEVWADIFRFAQATTVKATRFEEKMGREWKLERECARGFYNAGETCNPAFLIKCLRVTEPLEALMSVEVGVGVFLAYLIRGTCLA
jgi:hypothetical protein